MSSEHTGVLYVVATPIGNLDDISARALDTLRRSELILAEDTRRFQKLAARFGIQGRVISYHDHNERTRTPWIIEQLRSGICAALVSDAGTPAINDPGYHVLRAAYDAQIEVCAVPGPSSVITALSVCAFSVSPFVFLGFVPVKAGKREQALRQALDAGMAAVFFETPHRIVSTLRMLSSLDPERCVFVARELTKVHEELIRGKASEAAEKLENHSTKGEFVLVIEGPQRRQTAQESA